MAPSMSKLRVPPPWSAGSTWRRSTPPRAPAAHFARSPGVRRPAPAPYSSRPGRRRFAASCAPADLGGAATTGLAGSEGEGAAEEREGLPFVQMSSDMLRAQLSLLKDDAPPPADAPSSLLAMLPAVRKGDGHEDDPSGETETPAHPAAMNTLYLACLAGNATEQLWSFTWPAAMATLHPTSLLPVAVLGFFTKLVVFAAGPLAGDLLSSLPRIPAYRWLTVLQTAAHLVSVAMITYGFTLPRSASTASSALLLLLQPWFGVLVASTAADRLACVCLGVIAERDFVVQLAGGGGRPVALARANATLSRLDLLCETAGASVFAVLLSRNDPLTCVRLSCAISLCALPLMLFLGGAMNRLAGGIFDPPTAPPGSIDEHSAEGGSTHAAAAAFALSVVGRKAGEVWATVRRGWAEYVRQPVLPASLAYVFVCFNVALAPGALMTTFLIHHGVNPSVLGTFGGSSAAMGILATFLTPKLVKEMGILKAGAAGLIAQAALLGAAALVFFLTGPVSRRGALFAFLGLIVASRVGHMAYSVIGLQVVQTGNPPGKVKLIGATEIAVASLAELAMMAVAVAARDAEHFGCLAALSAASVAAAAGLFCAWLANPNHELSTLFPPR